MFGPSTSIRRQPLMTEPVGGDSEPGQVHEPDSSRVATQRELDKLDDVLVSFLAEHDETIIGTSRVMNPLLAVWEAAHDVSDVAAEPVERMLTVLVKRQHTSHDELARMVDAVREAVRSDVDARPVPAAV